VAERIGEETSLVTITTAGDRGEDVSDKSRWVSALERALLDREIDVAVHSAKDVPAQLADGLELVAIPERADRGTRSAVRRRWTRSRRAPASGLAASAGRRSSGPRAPT